MLSSRYRIVALAGRGGEGEVYRADDLKLAQPVALKVLPESVRSDERRLARLVQEVRIARGVSHPNVCRVYDIVEAEGQSLAALLRRKGLLPKNRAIGIARQIALGLAAAHDERVHHRDLKPSNIMIDDRGVMRITDFGMAMTASSVRGAAAREGTPLYMSPEQLAGADVTAQSDIYALGLVLFELFTGQHPFPGRTLEEMLTLRESPPPDPNSLAPALAKFLPKETESAALEREQKDRRASWPAPTFPRYRAVVAFGRRNEPWLVSVSEIATE